MPNKSSFKQTFFTAWELACDHKLPGMTTVDNRKNGQEQYIFNPLYALLLWGAAFGIIALIAGAILNVVLPVTGAAILFALIATLLSEMRTSGRGLALCISSFEELFAGRSFVEMRTLRTSFLRGLNGLIPLLMAVALLGGKFFAIMLVARTGHWGVTSMAMVAALGVEAWLSSEPSAIGVPRYCSEARQEYIIALAGFLFLFNLIALPLATLLAVAVSAVVAIATMNLCLRRCGEINSDDMTAAGYLAELAVWVVVMLMAA